MILNMIKLSFSLKYRRTSEKLKIQVFAKDFKAFLNTRESKFFSNSIWWCFCLMRSLPCIGKPGEFWMILQHYWSDTFVFFLKIGMWLNYFLNSIIPLLRKHDLQFLHSCPLVTVGLHACPWITIDLWIIVLSLALFKLRQVFVRL